MTSLNFNWQQMDLLPEPAGEAVRIEEINTLVGELAAADIVTINEVIKVHKLNKKEAELLVELLHINHILDVG